jgi:outer membrane receptor protein involved in Fe transport
MTMRKSIWLISAGLFALSTPAYAQQTDTDQGSAQPTDGATAEAAAVDNQATQTTAEPDSADIIVTATRRNEALSDVPLAVSAISGQSLANTGASDIRQLQQVSPSLLVSSTQSEGGASTARIRGIGTVGDNPGLESSVGVFIDGVYRSRVGAGLTELGAIDRVEVLRGPQGTLFGRNTSAGLISVITAKPKFTPEFAGAATVGNYNMKRLELSGTGPISDTIAARLDGVYMKRDGFLEDLISGRDVNNRNRWLLRGQMLYQPNDDLSVRVIADYSKRNEECCAAPYIPPSDAVRNPSGGVDRAPSTFVPISNALGGIVPPDPFDRNVVISRGRSFRGDVKDYGLSGEVVYDFGGAEMTSITAYRDNNLVRGTDVDYSNLDLVYRPDDGTALNRFKTFSQELRLQGTTFNDRLDWLVGGYYANENLRSRDSLRYGRDYGALAACTGAGLFAAQAGAPTLVAPTNPTCFQPLVATAIRDTPVTGLVAQYNAALAASNFTLAAALGQQITALAAFARLNNSTIVAPGVPPINFSGAPFGNNGFENLGLAQGTPFTFNDEGFVDDFRQKSNNFAIFTHNILSITERLKATVGLRYTSETKRLNADLTDNNLACRVFTSSTLLAQLPCINPSVPGGAMALDGKKKENKLSGTAVLSYKPIDELLTYVSYSRGYKAGGFNLDRSALARQNLIGQVCPTSGTLPTGCAGYASASNLEFKPEINNAFEVGMKFNGRGIDVNLAIFRQLFQDFQLNTFNGQNFIVETINSCENDLGGTDRDNSRFTGACTGDTRAGVKSRGVEFEAFTRPIRDVAVNFGATYVDTRYRKNLVGADGRALTNALFQLPGRRLSNAPEWTTTASFTYTPPIGSSGLRGLAYLDWRHQSGYNTGSDLDIEKIENGYNVFNGRIGLTGPDRAWAVELWANNLFNEDVYQIAFDAFLQGSGTQRGVEQGFYSRSNQLYGVFLAEPRTFGLTVRGKLGGTRPAAPAYVAPPAPPAPATQVCADGSVIAASAMCPVPPAPEPAPAPVAAPERG